MKDLIARGDVLKVVKKIKKTDYFYALNQKCVEIIVIEKAITAIPSAERKVDREKLIKILEKYMVFIIDQRKDGVHLLNGNERLAKKIAEAIEGDKC